MSNIGRVLIHCSTDSDGLLVNRTVANALDARNAENLRDGFGTGLLKLRGVHWVDPSAKPELKLAEQYRKKAETVENAGFHRLAITLRGIADSYDRDAERIITEHKQDIEK